MSDLDEQSDELLALGSIYDDSVFASYLDVDGLHTGTLKSSVELSHAVDVRLFTCPDTVYKAHYLPPVVLSFLMPADYPSLQPPHYSVICSWMTSEQVTLIRQKLDNIWDLNKGSVVLFMWMQFLQNEIASLLPLNCPLTVDANALTAILHHEQTGLEKVFNVSTFTCDICFCDKLGAACMKLQPCHHVFCRDCLSDYFEMHIKEGTVSKLSCLDQNCNSQIAAAQVKELVSEALFDRYDQLLLQNSLDMMVDVTYCPRLVCQAPVLTEPDESLGSCPSCHYTFCVYCRKVYHGVSRCTISSDNAAKLHKDYMEADKEGKRLLERRYGQRQIQSIVNDTFTYAWLTANAKQCPHCNAHIQKISGCNKMHCTKCHRYFCWICLAVINDYSHFNQPNTPCFNKLFHGLLDEVDEFDD